MSSAEQLEKLPPVYKLALQLRADGADRTLIADFLGVEVESVGVLLEIGAAKLADIERREAPRSPVC